MGSDVSPDLFELFPDLLALVADDGTLVRVNASWTALLGTPAEQLVGRTVAELTPAPDRDRVLDVFAAPHAPGPVQLEHRIHTLSGGLVWLQWRLQRLDDGWLGSARDVTAHKVALADGEAARLRARLLLDQAGDCMLEHDREGRITDASETAVLHTGFARDELIGTNVRELEIGDHSGPAAWERLRIGRPLTVHRQWLRKDGSTYPVEVRLRTYETPAGPRWVAFARDIEERERARAELERLNTELGAARDRAVAASRAKSAFVANMSHELRTPLNAIIGYAELLAEDIQAQGLVSFSADLERILGAASHLLALINDILDLSKIEAGRMELVRETFALGDLVEGVVATLNPLASRNDNTFVVEVEPGLGRITSDHTRLRQALINLLGNAMKFTERGKVVLRVRKQLFEGVEHVAFDVIDTGIGIPEDRLASLFDAFVQVDTSTSRRFGGTGLGLAISRHIARMLGGDIHVSSVLGEGSTFSFLIPHDTEEAPLRRADHIPRAAVAGAKVLVIDDDETVHDLFRRYLVKEGVELFSAFDGPSGIEIAARVQPHVILLDVLMPGMDGWTVLGALKGDPELADIPVVIASMVSDANLGFSLGAAEYLVKPIERDTLLNTLSRYVSPEGPSTVLIAEDEPQIREMLRRTLERAGWTVLEAADGSEALAILERHRPDVVLLDLMMPEVDGFEVMERLRENPDLADLPVVVVTAMELTTEQRARLQGHVERVLQKGSYSIHRLLAEVRSVVAAVATP